MVGQAEPPNQQAQAEEPEELSPLDAFIDRSHNQLEQVRTKLSEISMLVEQSQGEVDKLAQRNADITNRLHQIQSTFETVPREDILSAYEAAQDAQQRFYLTAAIRLFQIKHIVDNVYSRAARSQKR